MSEISSLERTLWAISFFLNVALVFLIFYRRNHKVYPFFCSYAIAAVLQNVAFYESYRIWGFFSLASARVAWSTQALVSIARALAVTEVCYRVLAGYRGIWQLAMRLLLGGAALVFLYAWAVSRGSWQFAVLNMDRALELAMASVLGLLVVFARSYEVSLETAPRTLTIGLFFYSGFRVLNDTMWGRWLNHYTALWGLLGTLTFLASLLLWSWALGHKMVLTAPDPALLSEEHYRLLSPAINARLKNLNERLCHFWDARRQKT